MDRTQFTWDLMRFGKSAFSCFRNKFKIKVLNM